MRMAVVGLGKVGLPLAVQCAVGGHEVWGCDRNPAVVDAVNAGRSPIVGEAELPERLATVVAAGRLRVTTDTAAAVSAAEAVVVAALEIARALVESGRTGAVVQACASTAPEAKPVL